MKYTPVFVLPGCRDNKESGILKWHYFCANETLPEGVVIRLRHSNTVYVSMGLSGREVPLTKTGHEMSYSKLFYLGHEPEEMKNEFTAITSYSVFVHILLNE